MYNTNMFIGAIFIMMYILATPYIVVVGGVAGPYMALWISSGIGGWLIFHHGIRQELNKNKDKQ